VKEETMAQTANGNWDLEADVIIIGSGAVGSGGCREKLGGDDRVDQMKSLDWRVRKAEFISEPPREARLATCNVHISEIRPAMESAPLIEL